jgi:hypothetical protein
MVSVIHAKNSETYSNRKGIEVISDVKELDQRLDLIVNGGSSGQLDRREVLREMERYFGFYGKSRSNYPVHYCRAAEIGRNGFMRRLETANKGRGKTGLVHTKVKLLSAEVLKVLDLLGMSASSIADPQLLKMYQLGEAQVLYKPALESSSIRSGRNEPTGLARLPEIANVPLLDNNGNISDQLACNVLVTPPIEAVYNGKEKGNLLAQIRLANLYANDNEPITSIEPLDRYAIVVRSADSQISQYNGVSNPRGMVDCTFENLS